MDWKTIKMDSRGRFCVPKELRRFFPEEAKMNIGFDGKKLILNMECADDVEFLTLEYLQNQILDLRRNIDRLAKSIEELRRMAFQTLIKPPT
jgi:bifunctional DNA-binding transcriptional regulator/antitoxin component of YhaV-PrlF toxin-antitoxin module